MEVAISGALSNQLNLKKKAKAWLGGKARGNRLLGVSEDH